ncbi:MAG: NAD+ synthase [bacterium]|nr:NAD+ synthase [bacterium]
MSLTRSGEGRGQAPLLLSHSAMEHLSLDLPAVHGHLVRFLRESVTGAGFRRAVLGLSGGIDSALVAALAVEALGAEQVLGLILPWRTSQPASVDDARQLAEQLGMPVRRIDISPMVDAFSTALAGAGAPIDPPDARRLGNVMARCRMVCLFDAAMAWQALPLGTSNKSELLLGYGTWHGDLASAVNPIGDLYKQQVFALARHLGLPAAIIDKAPSADLEEGQTDEGDLGWSYELIDRILVRAVDQRRDRASLLAEGFAGKDVDGILDRVARNHFKRMPPVIAKVGLRAIGADWLYQRDSLR